MPRSPLIVKNESPNDVLFWRSPVDRLDVNSMILVRSTDCAIFEKGGVLLDLLEAGEHAIFDKKSKFFGLFDAKVGPSSVEIIYMSKTAKLQVFWGTSTQFDFRDPVYNVPVKVGASGEFEVQIDNPRKFYQELVGRDPDYSIDKLKTRLQGRMLAIIEPEIAKIMKESKLSYYSLTEHKPLIQEAIYNQLNRMFKEDYGLKFFSFTISRIFLSESSKEAIEDRINIDKSKEEKEKEKSQQEIDRIREREERERQEDRQFEKDIHKKRLESEDKRDYLDAVKIVGFENQPKKEDKKSCPKCSCLVDKDIRFCGECGADTMFSKCKSCGYDNKPTVKFCGRCGEKL